MNSTTTKRVVALEEHGCELHAIRIQTLELMERAFDEVESRVARITTIERNRSATNRAA